MMKKARKRDGWENRRIAVLLLGVLLLSLGNLPVKGDAALNTGGAPVNLALDKPAMASSAVSGREAGKAVDGSRDTYWQPASTDREDMSVHIQVELGSGQPLNQVILDLNRGDNLKAVEIDYSLEGESWSRAFTKTEGIRADGQERISFDAVTASQVRITLQLSRNLNVQLKEMEIYMQDGSSEIPVDVTELAFVKEDGTPFGNNDELSLEIGGTAPLEVRGRGANGEWAALPPHQIRYLADGASSTVTPDGTVTGRKVGATRIYAEASVGGKTVRSPDLWFVVKDEHEFEDAKYVAFTSFRHPALTQRIGEAAILEETKTLPVVMIAPNLSGSVSARWLRDGQSRGNLGTKTLIAGEDASIQLPGGMKVPGTYEIQMTFHMSDGGTYYDSLYYTVMPKNGVPDGQSRIAYVGKNGRMVYVPDYKGNRIIDFSHVGYQGGGVRLPDVQAEVAVEPTGGDDTAMLQAAIDEVSRLPRDADGFRGAVLLRSGTYFVGGTLRIQASGVVLRGEGKDDNGTIIRGTGTAARNLIEVGGTAGPSIVEGTETDIQDLYVPAGSRTFHVQDASGYKAGDSVIVRRIGSERWIHEIGMDHIFMRPLTGGTKQWTPFNLDFDRVITAIDGNRITVDAPLANAIERQWGGGKLFKATDEERIEQVGIENMRAVSDFDPSKTDTKMDNDVLDTPYYSDEDHAERFIMMNSVKNAWVREVEGYHFSYALVQVGRQAKWVTVQDSEMYDMVSIITGGRRYSLFIQGQLNLVQRNYTETSRHAYVIESRVQGPNVMYDNRATREYNTSEPHHRWSTGGLYDNVSARISVRDRAWLGSGHGWAGANYVMWNTEGGLVAQKPPTAQNYAIGHVPTEDGLNVRPLVPNDYDPRPREDGYWESTGRHVAPQSLFIQQLKDRLGQEAVDHLARTPVGGGALDVPELP
ncbi:discoidin domain-containing protein [Paenibacillus lactis]|uniref:discoidin domain-containing protein n=1 Tax=Paenibacillus lactis TaxID=228574 RepID=UPI00203E4E36|nr:discoidin domain-containing protein [Paenibacillus lactis]MCM3494853.1 discoidin domain-containing protein [Paenibacillus lactis]